MTDYAMLADARTFARLQKGQLTAQPATVLADTLRRMSAGERVVPLYASVPAHGEDELRAFRVLVEERLGRSSEEVLDEYRTVAGTVPHLLEAEAASREEFHGDDTAVVVPVKIHPLEEPLSAAEFLRLRDLNPTAASQFKGSAPARPIQEVSRSLVQSVTAASQADRDEVALFRSLSLVVTQNPQTATELLMEAGRPPQEGDSAFLVTRATVPGLVTADANGRLSEPLQPIAHSPEAIKSLLLDAQRKATPSDPFDATSAIEASDELLGLLNGTQSVRKVDDYVTFYKFRILSRAVTQAIELAKRPLPSATPVSPEAMEYPDDSTAAALQGLSVEAVLAELPDGFVIDRSVVAAAVASLRAGKHLLLGGPPGTGKTTLAEALCRAVVSTNYDVTTATADWTTFDTIGGYLPVNGGLKFVPGVVLRSLRTSGWLIIDEVNRADIDKAFGPLFTVLSGGEGSAGRTSVLPYTASDGKPVTIEWSPRAATRDGVYAITPSWRLIGTLNVSDKSSLFRLSFAFLRRFAVIDVPIPTRDEYRSLFTRWFAALDRRDKNRFVELALAVVDGPVPTGPAIGRDFARLIVEGLTETASGEPTFATDDEAILTAVRLLVVPQYEGQPLTSGNKILEVVDEHIAGEGLAARRELETALREVALS